MDTDHSRKQKIGPFVPANSDGCTALSWPYHKLTGKRLPFRSHCVQHDEAYWYGGTKQQRKTADFALFMGVRSCVKPLGGTSRSDKMDHIISKVWYTVLAAIMYGVVRVLGSPKTGLPWRWSYSSPISIRTCLSGYEKDID